MDFNGKIISFFFIVILFGLFDSTELANITVNATISAANFTFNYNFQPKLNTNNSEEAFVSLNFLKDNKEFFKLVNISNSKNSTLFENLNKFCEFYKILFLLKFFFRSYFEQCLWY
jgi:hypothetical protein